MHVTLGHKYQVLDVILMGPITFGCGVWTLKSLAVTSATFVVQNLVLHDAPLCCQE